MLDSFLLWLLCSILAAAVASFLLLVFTGRTPGAPFYFVPAVTLIVALLLVLAAGVALPPVKGPIGQAAAVLMIAWGGWALTGWRR